MDSYGHGLAGCLMQVNKMHGFAMKHSMLKWCNLKVLNIMFSAILNIIDAVQCSARSLKEFTMSILKNWSASKQIAFL